MRTIALRFADHFAPPEGTIKAHESIIHEKGFVWYGKIGAGLSEKTKGMILNNLPPRILLIHSGRTDRYWAYITEIQKEKPPEQFIPKYYADKYDKVGVWFCITSLQKASPDIVGRCKLVSSGATLTEASRKNMNPLFIIDYTEEKET